MRAGEQRCPSGAAGGTAGDPPGLAHRRLLRFSQRRQSEPACLVAGNYACVCGVCVCVCEGMRIGKGERMVQRRPFHATQLPGSQSSEMPKESSISFIGGQTEQPGVEGPLEDNIS